MMVTTATEARPFLSPAQAADTLGVSRYTVCRLIRSGQLPSVRVGGQLRIPKRTLAAKLAETRGGWPIERTIPRAEGSTTARGYGSRHQAERRRWALVVESGAALCVRCGLPIAPGARWHLDHRDDGLGYLGPAHAMCNLRAAAKRGNKLMRAKQALNQPPGSRRMPSTDW
jgi:excisionase family DNA binding protein